MRVQEGAVIEERGLEINSELSKSLPFLPQGQISKRNSRAGSQLQNDGWTSPKDTPPGVDCTDMFLDFSCSKSEPTVLPALGPQSTGPRTGGGELMMLLSGQELR